MSDQHNFEIAVNWLKEHQKVTPEDQILVQHETWCPVWYGKVCDCTPDIFRLVQGEEKTNQHLISYPTNILRKIN